MPARFDRKTAPRVYHAYTGTSHQAILGGGRLDRETPIPQAASSDQEVLESLVFTALADCRQIVSHPFGVKQISLPADGGVAIVRLVDTICAAESTESYADWLVQAVLPHAVDESGYSNGIANVRVACVTRQDLTLTLLGTDACLVFRGGRRTDWRRVLREFQCRLESTGGAALWNWLRSFLTDPKRMKLHDQRPRGLAWLGSGLMRRAAIFHSANSSFYVHGWEGMDELKFEFDTLVGVSATHDRFVNKLIDPVWGLPLTIEERHCYCDDRRGYHCWFNLAHRDGGKRALHLRFTWTERQHLGSWRNMLKATGAQQSRLDEILPEHLCPQVGN